MSVPELSVQIKNSPGQLVRITTILAEAGVNIRGLAASSAGKVGWVRLLVDQTKVAEEALEECGIAVDTGEAVAVYLVDEAGAVDGALRTLADDKMNVDYVYTAGTGPGGATPGKAEKTLKAVGIEIADLPNI